jgi:hypothetical protein
MKLTFGLIFLVADEFRIRSAGHAASHFHQFQIAQADNAASSALFAARFGTVRAATLRSDGSVSLGLVQPVQQQRLEEPADAVAQPGASGR